MATFVDFVVHRDACNAVKQIGRFGSRSGLRWQPGDQKACSCGLREWLEEVCSAYSHAENGNFHNNSFTEAEEWEKKYLVLAEALDRG